MDIEAAAKLERKLVKFVLNTGLAVAVCLMILGVIVNLTGGTSESVSISLLDLYRGKLTWGNWLLGAGIFVLATTPILRILILTSLWILERDWRFVGVSVVVLITLAISIAVGGG